MEIKEGLFIHGRATDERMGMIFEALQDGFQICRLDFKHSIFGKPKVIAFLIEPEIDCDDMCQCENSTYNNFLNQCYLSDEREMSENDCKEKERGKQLAKKLVRANEEEKLSIVLESLENNVKDDEVKL